MIGTEDADGNLRLGVLASTNNGPDDRTETALAAIDGRLENHSHTFRGIWTMANQTNVVAFKLIRVAEFKELRRETREGKFSAIYLAHYPVFQNSSPFYAAVNAKLREPCEKECASFISDLSSSETSVNCKDTEDISIACCKRDIISASVYCYEFSGGAHGMHGCYGLNFIADNGQAKKIELADLFLAGSGWEKKLSDYCIAELRKQQASSVVDGKVKELSPNRLTFTVLDSGLQIYFSPYEAGSYAEGFFEVDMPWSVMRNFLQMRGPIKQIVE